jgi:hypothetical protein
MRRHPNPDMPSTLAIAGTPMLSMSIKTKSANRTKMHRQTMSRKPKPTKPRLLGCVMLAAALAAQLAWARRVALIRDPATQSWALRVCTSLDCRLPPIRDIAKLELLSRDIRPDPDAAGALTITATLRNDARFRQPWPIVVVELTDLDNNVVAMRRFRPAEYMPDPARRTAGIAPETTAAVAFEVADPGKRAVSFHFGFE